MHGPDVPPRRSARRGRAPARRGASGLPSRRRLPRGPAAVLAVAGGLLALGLVVALPGVLRPPSGGEGDRAAAAAPTVARTAAGSAGATSRPSPRPSRSATTTPGGPASLRTSDPGFVVLEAEDGDVGGGGRVQGADDASGGEVVGQLHDEGAWVEVSFDSPADGTARVALRYSNGRDDPSDFRLWVDGDEQDGIEFDETGGWESFDVLEVDVPVEAGGTTLRLECDDDGEGTDIDVLAVTPPGAVTSVATDRGPGR